MADFNEFSSPPSSTASTLSDGSELVQEPSLRPKNRLQATAKKNLEKRWLPLEDKLLIWHSVHSYNTKHVLARKIASGIPLTRNQPPILRTASAISARLSHLKACGIIPHDWYPGSPRSKSSRTPFTEAEDAEIIRWHVSDRASLDASIFVPNNRCGAEVRRREEVLCHDRALVAAVENSCAHLHSVTRWFEAWRRAQQLQDDGDGVAGRADFGRMPRGYPRTAEGFERYRAAVGERIRMQVRVARERLAEEEARGQ